MIIQSKHTKTFVSDSLTKEKYNELQSFAVTLRNHKNLVSDEVTSNLMFYHEMSKFDFIRYMRDKYKGIISSSFDAQLYTHVYTCYENRFVQLRRKLKFEKVEYLGLEFYKRTTKKNKKGEFKKTKIKKSETDLSKTLTYLIRCEKESVLKYIQNQRDIEFFSILNRVIDKFGFERLWNLTRQKREYVLGKYKEPIEFKKLTFGGRCRKKDIISYNKNYNSIINSFITLSGFDGRKSFDIPVKFAKDYHGSMKDWHKLTNDYEYVICFDEYNKTIKVNLCKECERYMPENKKSYVGIDVNSKHNLFSCSDGEIFDYNHKLVKDYLKERKRTDGLKSENNYYQIGKRRQHKIDTISNKIRYSNKNLISEMCKILSSKGFDHIVMENLDNGFEKSFAKTEEFDDVNYNRLVSALNLSSLKDEVRHIAQNYGMQLSIVHSSYTSQMCPECGNLDKNNRKTQEDFECTCCGHKDNADHNASVNIRNRASETVFRPLLKQNVDGSFEPLYIKRCDLKDKLLSFRGSMRTRTESYSCQTMSKNE